MLYFVRHGQTNHNLNKLLAGRCDISLNENGLKQAHELAFKSKNIHFDLIFCSPLLRAKQTCEIINKEHDATVIIKEELVERDFGIYESKEYSCIESNKAWNYYSDAYNGEMESLKDVFKRVNKVLEEIKIKYKGKNILIVAHNDIGRAIHCYFNGIPENGELLDLSFSNADIVEYDKFQ